MFNKTMKTIFLIRHADAIPKRFGTHDRDRPLTKEGEKAAKKMARRLAKNGVSPDMIVSSPADRALETAQIFAAVLKYPMHNILIDSSLYEHEGAACWESLLPTIRSGTVTLMLFGHNPSLPKLAEFFAGPFDLPLPKAGFVRIRLPADGEWRAVQAGSGEIMDHDYPDRKKKKLLEIQAQVQEGIMGGLADYIHLIGRHELPRMEKQAGKAGRKIARLIVKKAVTRPDASHAAPSGRKAE